MHLGLHEVHLRLLCADGAAPADLHSIALDDPVREGWVLVLLLGTEGAALNGCLRGVEDCLDDDGRQLNCTTTHAKPLFRTQGTYPAATGSLATLLIFSNTPSSTYP